MRSTRAIIIKRITELATGYAAWKIMDDLFDYALYPFVLWQLGLVRGGLIMSALSLLSCLCMLRLYDRLGRDWLGIEFVKQHRHYDGPSWWRRWIAWAMIRGDWLAFILLSLKNDPFITTAYLRRGAYNGMSARDWRIFLGSWAISNGAWMFLCYGSLSVFKKIGAAIFS